MSFGKMPRIGKRMTEYVVMEFLRPLYNTLGEPTNERCGWFPSSDAAGIEAALEAGAVEVGRTEDAAVMEMLLAARLAD
jgi:hypothetical protein